MKLILIIIFLLLHVIYLHKPNKEFGFRHFKIFYNDDNVDILIKSKKGEENVSKPLLFYCQGSLPQPLIKNKKLLPIFEKIFAWGSNKSLNDVDLANKYPVEDSKLYCSK